MAVFRAVSFLVASSLAVRNVLAAQIPPNFSPSSDNQLGLAYGPGMSDSRVVQPGDQLPFASMCSLRPILHGRSLICSRRDQSATGPGPLNTLCWLRAIFAHHGRPRCVCSMLAPCELAASLMVEAGQL